MKKHCLGITLFECVSYVAIAALISLILFRWWVICHGHLNFLEKKTSHCIQEQLLYQVIARDIACANPEIEQWKVIHGRLKCTIGNDRVSYIHHADTISRSIKRCGSMRNASSVITRAVEQITWKLISHRQNVTAVAVTIRYVGENPKNWVFTIKKGLF